MAPKSWDAGHELHALRERMSRLFEEELPRQGGERAGAFSPATDVYLTDDAVVVTVELPGVDPAEVAIRCEGKVLTIHAKTNRVTIEGINIVKRHQRARRAEEQSAIIEKPAPMALSNVMLIDPKSGNATRIKARLDADGTKERLSVKSGESIARPAR